MSTITLSPRDWEAYRRHPVVTEFGFVMTLSAPCARQQGNVRLMVWSLTGRRTEASRSRMSTALPTECFSSQAPATRCFG